MLKRLKLLSCGAALLMATSVPLAAKELRVAPAAPPAHPAYSALYSSFVELLPQESGGKLTAKIYGTEIVDLKQMKSALTTNLVDVGNFLPMYFPADVPNSALTGDLALLGRNSQAMGAAVMEYIVTCPECLAEYKKMGLVYAGSGSSDVYALLTTKPINSVADLRGLRLRSGGAPFSRWAEAMGATPANIQVNDTFEAMSQGVIDGTMASVADLLSFRLIELVKNVTDLKLGTYHATSNFTTGMKAWKEMSVEERKALVRAANRASTRFTEAWGYQRPGVAREKAKEAGIVFAEAPAELVAKTEEFVKADIATAVKNATDKYSVQNAEEKIARFQALVDKWTRIAEELDNDAEKVAAAVQKEVWDKVDYESYGL